MKKVQSLVTLANAKLDNLENELKDIWCDICWL